MWSTSDNINDVMLTNSSMIRMVSGEPGCRREVKILGVGGGGSSSYYKSGAGSGYVESTVVNITANRDIIVTVGAGGELSAAGGETSVAYSEQFGGDVFLTAAGGAAAGDIDEDVSGGDGYSGGGGGVIL